MWFHPVTYIMPFHSGAAPAKKVLDPPLGLELTITARLLP